MLTTWLNKKQQLATCICPWCVLHMYKYCSVLRLFYWLTDFYGRNGGMIVTSQLLVLYLSEPSALLFFCRNSTPTDDVMKSMSAEEREIYDRLMQKAKCDDMFDDIEPGPDCMSGSQLPSHSDVNKSCLTNQRIMVGRSSVSSHLTLFKCSL